MLLVHGSDECLWMSSSEGRVSTALHLLKYSSEAVFSISANLHFIYYSVHVLKRFLRSVSGNSFTVLLEYFGLKAITCKTIHYINEFLYCFVISARNSTFTQVLHPRKPRYSAFFYSLPLCIHLLNVSCISFLFFSATSSFFVWSLIVVIT